MRIFFFMMEYELINFTIFFLVPTKKEATLCRILPYLRLLVLRKLLLQIKSSTKLIFIPHDACFLLAINSISSLHCCLGNVNKLSTSHRVLGRQRVKMSTTALILVNGEWKNKNMDFLYIHQRVNIQITLNKFISLSQIIINTNNHHRKKEIIFLPL